MAARGSGWPRGSPNVSTASNRSLALVLRCRLTRAAYQSVYGDTNGFPMRIAILAAFLIALGGAAAAAEGQDIAPGEDSTPDVQGVYSERLCSTRTLRRRRKARSAASTGTCSSTARIGS
jgi:hypothetical protein